MAHELSQAVILAGGRGTRLMPLTEHSPKPMVDIHGRPFLHYLIEQLAMQGIEEVLLLTGYLGDQVEAYFKDGSEYGVSIRYSRGDDDWDTARRIFRSRDLLAEQFFLLYGDNFTLYRLAEMYDFFLNSNANLSLGLSSKENGNIRCSADGRITVYDSTRTQKDLDMVELGYMIVNRDPVLSLIDDSVNRSFSDILKLLVEKKDIAGFLMRDRYYSISDPERLELMREYLKPKRVVLLDRDGTICVKADRGKYITTIEDFVFLDGAIEGLQMLSDAGFQMALITNQAGISTGDLTEEGLAAIHQHMNHELEQHGVQLDRVYCCFDHWQDTNSWRRKPNPGMLLEASEDLKFRLDESYYVGDDIRDMIAAYKANCRGIFIGDEAALKDIDPGHRPVFCAKDLSIAASYIMEHQ